MRTFQRFCIIRTRNWYSWDVRVHRKNILEQLNVFEYCSQT
jgi:hypothetical protein